MKNRMSFLVLAVCAVVSFAANSQLVKGAWWVDHDPNHIVHAAGISPNWWVDHDPNH